MNNSELLWERSGSEDKPKEAPSEEMGQQDTLRVLTETTEAIEQLYRDMATWHEHQVVFQDSLQSLNHQMANQATSVQAVPDDQLNGNLADLVHTLDERLGRVNVEHRFAQLEERMAQLGQNIRINQSELVYIKEKMQLIYGILIAVPAFFLVSLLLWLWLF